MDINEIKYFKNKVDDLLEIIRFYNENFYKFEPKINKLYFESLSNRYEKLLFQKEEILRG